MSGGTSREQYLESVRQRIILAARSFLSADAALIETARELSTLLARVDDPELEEPRSTFRAIESDTDHLPVGGARDRWAPDALVKADSEIAEAESFHANDTAEACRSILNHLEPAS